MSPGTGPLRRRKLGDAEIHGGQHGDATQRVVKGRPIGINARREKESKRPRAETFPAKWERRHKELEEEKKARKKWKRSKDLPGGKFDTYG